MTESATPMYGDAFFEEQRDESQRSAQVVVPYIMTTVGPSSVIDVGCGTGTWLSEFSRAGCREILGLDGHDQPASRLLVPPDKVRRVDLTSPPTIDSRYDLAVCLEVAEHLEPAYAGLFVAFLTSLAPVVLFSAAIPHQTGIGHVNEQWPSYWAKLFAAHNYVPGDFLRHLFWEDSRIAYWYRQNIVLFGQDEAIQAILRKAGAQNLAQGESVLSLVHPEAFLALHARVPKGPPSIRAAIRAKLGRVIPS